MAKTKKAAQPSADNVVEVNDGGSQPASKPAKKLKGNFKAHAIHNSVRDMVNSALRAKASADGVSLTTIRTFVSHNYNNKKRLGKDIQDRIKKYITEEFQKGTIQAANTTDKILKFNAMRFNMAGK